MTAEAFYGPGYDDCDERIPDIGKAQRLLGWDPRTLLPDMLPPIVTDYLQRYGPAIAAEAQSQRIQRVGRGEWGSASRPEGQVSLWAVVPAYDAARHLPGVIDRLVRSAPTHLAGIVVVDDGSSDTTVQEAKRLAARESRLVLVERARNGGYGAAMKDGLAAARAAGATTVACIHADGQYSPEALGRLLSELEARGLDLLQGSRIAPGTALAGGMPLYKFVANAGLNRLENLVLGLGLSDYHSGYLLYGPRVLAAVPFARLSDSFDFDLEVIASARAARAPRRRGAHPHPLRRGALAPAPHRIRLARAARPVALPKGTLWLTISSGKLRRCWWLWLWVAPRGRRDRPGRRPTRRFPSGMPRCAP